MDEQKEEERGNIDGQPQEERKDGFQKERRENGGKRTEEGRKMNGK
jgi:hypothetical protein